MSKKNTFKKTHKKNTSKDSPLKDDIQFDDLAEIFDKSDDSRFPEPPNHKPLIFPEPPNHKPLIFPEPPIGLNSETFNNIRDNAVKILHEVVVKQNIIIDHMSKNCNVNPIMKRHIAETRQQYNIYLEFVSFLNKMKIGGRRKKQTMKNKNKS